MGKLSVKEIRDRAIAIVNSSPGGIRYGNLVTKIRSEFPETNTNTIGGSIYNLHELFPGNISKPSRGLYAPIGHDAAGAQELRLAADTVVGAAGKVSEEEFYEPFAEWLKNDLDEATEAVALGGAGIRTKWGTPDIIGTYKPLPSDLIKFPLEIISAELKITKDPITAFGQAIAYRLFSAKTYIAMPKTLGEEDLSRLEALCILFGVGLALFDLNVEEPNFEIRVRAQRFSPDMFYVNEFADRLKDHDPERFEMLFR